jgi:hypothetical protein
MFTHTVRTPTENAYITFFFRDRESDITKERISKILATGTHYPLTFFPVYLLSLTALFTFIHLGVDDRANQSVTLKRKKLIYLFLVVEQ